MVAFRFIIIIFIIFILFFVIITTICVNCIIALSFLSSFSDLSPFLLIPLFLVCSLLLCFLSQLLISRFKMSTISNAILFLISFSPRPEQQCNAAGSKAHDARGLHLGGNVPAVVEEVVRVEQQVEILVVSARKKLSILSSCSGRAAS